MRNESWYNPIEQFVGDTYDFTAYLEDGTLQLSDTITSGFYQFGIVYASLAFNSLDFMGT